MNLYLIFLIALCNVTCLRASRVVVSLFALQLGATQFVIGLLIAMYSLFPALLALYAGRLSDRRGTRLPMLIGSIGLVMGLLLPAALHCALVAAWLLRRPLRRAAGDFAAWRHLRAAPAEKGVPGS